jgi:hypothetical protein
MELPVFAVNKIGGIVYVGKNILTACLMKDNQEEITVDTQRLLTLLESRNYEKWKSEEFVIEPMILDGSDGAMLVRIWFFQFQVMLVWIDVFRCDLIEALKAVEAQPKYKIML